MHCKATLFVPGKIYAEITLRRSNPRSGIQSTRVFFSGIQRDQYHWGFHQQVFAKPPYPHRAFARIFIANCERTVSEEFSESHFLIQNLTERFRVFTANGFLQKCFQAFEVFYALNGLPDIPGNDIKPTFQDFDHRLTGCLEFPLINAFLKSFLKSFLQSSFKPLPNAFFSPDVPTFLLWS